MAHTKHEQRVGSFVTQVCGFNAARMMADDCGQVPVRQQNCPFLLFGPHRPPDRGNAKKETFPLYLASKGT